MFSFRQTLQDRKTAQRGERLGGEKQVMLRSQQRSSQQWQVNWVSSIIVRVESIKYQQAVENMTVFIPWHSSKHITCFVYIIVQQTDQLIILSLQ